MNKEKISPHTVVIFGATGDLAKKKLIPSLYRLYSQGVIDEFPIICVGRKRMSDEAYLKFLDIGKYDKDRKKLKKFVKHLRYIDVDLNKSMCFELAEIVQVFDKKCGCAGNKIFYLALPYFLFGKTIGLIKNCGLLNGRGSKKIAFEKPFGSDLKSAEILHKQIGRFFREEDIYRVDHYLGKELVENIVALRFANSLFEHLWNTDSIDNVQITLAEDIGIENRGGYYDKSGAIRDMVQNHILQLIALVGMEPPKSLNADDIRNEKVKVLKNLRSVRKKDLVIGQYVKDPDSIGYRNEKNVDKKSITESFVAFKTYINNSRWRGVPFYVRTGKRMNKKYSEINIVLKDVTCGIFQRERAKHANVISIRTNPKESVDFLFNAKIPFTRNELKEAVMEFCHKCEFGPNTPEAYETLFHQLLQGNQGLFTRWDEVKASWRFVDNMKRMIKNKRIKLLPYRANSEGPNESFSLLRRDGRNWKNIKRRFAL
jgi:glucose-6-phosphate 1-dehydrogenase